MTIRVLLAEDNALLRQGLERLLGAPGRSRAGRRGGQPARVAPVPRPSTVPTSSSATSACRRPTRTRASPERRRSPPSAGDRRRAAQPARRGRVRGALPRAGFGAPRLPAQGARRRRHANSSTRSAPSHARRLGDRPDGRRAARAGTDRTPDSALDRLSPREREVLGRWRWARTTPPSPATLFLTERAVEKHTNAIFGKLGFAEEPELNRRVAAVLMYLQRAA